MRQRKGVLILGILILCIFSQTAFSLQFGGRVYEGNVGDESSPIQNVTVKLYASQDANYIGVAITSATTDANGWYGLQITEGYEYYNIVEVDPAGYYSIDATSVDGIKINSNQIQYSVVEMPLQDQTLTGNKFWDKKTTSPGTITIKKQAHPADNTPFNFTSDLGSFTLTYPSDSTIYFSNVQPGQYDFQETITSGWTLDQITVYDSNGGSSGDVSSASAHVRVDDGENILVIFINHKEFII